MSNNTGCNDGDIYHKLFLSFCGLTMVAKQTSTGDPWSILHVTVAMPVLVGCLASLTISRLGFMAVLQEIRVLLIGINRRFLKMIPKHPFRKIQAPSEKIYPLVNVYIAMERSTIFNGKIHYFYGHFPLLFVSSPGNPYRYMGLSENVGYIPNEIAIFHRDNDQQNHWVQWGTNHFQTHPHIYIYNIL